MSFIITENDCKDCVQGLCKDAYKCLMMISLEIIAAALIQSLTASSEAGQTTSTAYVTFFNYFLRQVKNQNGAESKTKKAGRISEK